MSDIHCSICNEPWDIYGLSNGDVKAWEADMIRAGKGCPCCVANGKTPKESYVKPEPEIIFHCACCDEDMVIDQDKYTYDGDDKVTEFVQESFTSEDGLICQDCLDNHYTECDGCKKTFHEDNTSYLQNFNKVVCEKCFDNYSSCTICCGDIQHCDDLTYHDGEYYCERCAGDLLYYCDKCGDAVFKEDVVWDDIERGFCTERCREQANGKD